MKGYVYDDDEDDQRYWTTKYLNFPELISLDHENLLFLNLFGADLSKLHFESDTLMYKGRSPQVVHANGPNKEKALSPVRSLMADTFDSAVAIKFYARAIMLLMWNFLPLSARNLC